MSAVEQEAVAWQAGPAEREEAAWQDGAAGEGTLAEPLGEGAGEGAGGVGEIPGMAEACRRFPLPDEALAARALRELEWGEHFVAGRMVPSKGGTDLYLYSLKEAARFLLDRDEANVGKGSDQMIKLVDTDAFIAWVRDVVGDGPLAEALAEDCLPDDPYADRLRAIQMLTALRMVQYGGL